MIDPVAEVLRRLRGQGIEPRPCGTGWTSRCPAHEDRTPSLSITRGSDGRALVYCHAGCPFLVVAASLGLETHAFFLENASTHGVTRSLTATAAPVPLTLPATTNPVASPKFYGTLGEALKCGRGDEPVRTWLYNDANNRVAGAVARFETRYGKTFRQASLSDNGLWLARGMTSPRPLYRLPSLISIEGPVYVVEGEKCADALVALGLNATTSVGGAGSAHHSDWLPLKNRRVFIIPDADVPGVNYGAAVAALAHAAGAAEVRIVDIGELWPTAPEKADIADWIAECALTPAQMLREAIETHANEAPLFETQTRLPIAVISSRRLRTKGGHQ